MASGVVDVKAEIEPSPPAAGHDDDVVPSEWGTMTQGKRLIYFVGLCQAGKVDAVQELLALSGSSAVNPFAKRTVALRSACNAGKSEVVKVLVGYTRDGRQANLRLVSSDCLRGLLRRGDFATALWMLRLPPSRAPDILATVKQYWTDGCSSMRLPCVVQAATSGWGDVATWSELMWSMLACIPPPQHKYWQEDRRTPLCFQQLCARILQGVCSSWGWEGEMSGKPQALLSTSAWSRLPPHVADAFHTVLQGTLPPGLRVYHGSATHCSPLRWATRYWSGTHTFNLSDAKFLAALPTTRTCLQQVPCLGNSDWMHFSSHDGTTPHAFLVPGCYPALLAVGAAHPGIGGLLRRMGGGEWIDGLPPVRSDLGPWELDRGGLHLFPGTDITLEPGIRARLQGMAAADLPSIVDMPLGMCLALPPPTLWSSTTSMSPSEKWSLHGAVSVWGARCLAAHTPCRLTPQVAQRYPHLRAGVVEGNWRLRKRLVLARACAR